MRCRCREKAAFGQTIPIAAGKAVPPWHHEGEDSVSGPLPRPADLDL